jgi:hypothetical protein
MLLVHNVRLLDYLRYQYSPADVQRLTDFLRREGTFRFPALPTGLYPAAHLADDDPSGYANVWIRDNVHVAHALSVDGQTEAAVRTVQGFATFLQTQLPRIARILDGTADHAEPMNRPHIRFDGRQLAELDERWSHAQNDALGYFLWIAGRLVNAGQLPVTDELAQVMAAVALFLEKIDFVRDEDSGHWEETRKVNASSIGPATAGLRELHAALGRADLFARCEFHGQRITIARLEPLIAAGHAALAASVPYECRDTDERKRREADAALLFLIDPLDIVDETQADAIIELVLRDLQGDIGIRRYRGDSYWCADYKQKLAADERSADYSEDLTDRDALLTPGQEAQWCIFDPILSTVFGRRYRQTGDPRWLAQQARYLNRSLGHLTADDSPFGGLRCPESYYLEQGRYVPVDQTPLLWTQANLLVALKMMT